MKTLLVLLVGIVVGVGGYWYLSQDRSKQDLQRASDEVVAGAEKVKESVKKAVEDINTEEIKKELERTGMIIREKAKQAGAAIADATADARITTAIKTKYATDAGVSAMKVKVDTTDGLVTLSGTANSYEEVTRAVKLAFETEGVRKVVSTIQVTAAK